MYNFVKTFKFSLLIHRLNVILFAPNLFQGHLTVNVESEEVSVEWDKELISLKSNMAYGGRGMELSELIVFNGKLYAVDDRTGIIYEVDLHEKKVIPWVVLTDGNGRNTKGNYLYILVCKKE